GLALGDPVAHCGNTARDLGGRADRARLRPDQFRIMLIGFVSGEHVIVGGDDAQIRRHPLAQNILVACRASGEAMRLISAAQASALRRGGRRADDAVEIARPRIPTAPDDRLGDLANSLVQNGHALSSVSCVNCSKLSVSLVAKAPGASNSFWL